MKLWDISSATCLKTFTGHAKIVHAVAFSPDGRLAVSGSWDNTLRLWDISSGTCLRTFTEHGKSVRSIAFSADGRLVLAGDEDASLKLWDVSWFSVPKPTHVSWIASRLSRGEESARDEQLFQEWWRKAEEALSKNDAAEALNMLAKARSVQGYERTPEILALASRIGSLCHVRSLYSGWLKRSFDEHEKSIHAVAFSPDASLIVSGSQDNTLRLWDTSTGNCLRTLKGHEGSVNSVTFSPDGRFLLSGADVYRQSDSAIKLWDVATGTCLRTFKRQHRPHDVNSVAFSHDGRLALSLIFYSSRRR